VNPTQILDLALQFAKHAGDTALHMQRSQGFEVTMKHDSSFLTNADIAADEIIRQSIESKFPSHKILSEESASSIAAMPSEPLWVIDPIDGTTNFSRGIPYWAVSIGVAWDGFVQVGVVYAPQLGETFSAVRGQGAKLNSQQIPQLPSTTLEVARKTLVATGFHPADRAQLPALIAQFGSIANSSHDIRRMGAASLDCTSVACGRYDAYYESVHPWDIAAGGLIAREAGAKSGHYPGLSGIGTRDHHLIGDLQAENFLVANCGAFERVLRILSGG